MLYTYIYSSNEIVLLKASIWNALSKCNNSKFISLKIDLNVSCKKLTKRVSDDNEWKVWINVLNIEGADASIITYGYRPNCTSCFAIGTR